MDDDLKERVRRLLEEGGLKSAKVTELIKALGLRPTEKGTVRRIIRELAAEGSFAKIQRQRASASRTRRTVTGTLRMSGRGFGFVIPQVEAKDPGEEEGSGGAAGGDRPQDIFIPKRRLGDALHGDKVRVLVMGETGRERHEREGAGLGPEGQILEVIERGTNQIVGAFYTNKRGGTVVPRDERIGRTIAVTKPDPALRIKDGTWVVVEVTDWTRSPDPLLGRVIESLGTEETPGIDITVIVRSAGVDPEFPEQVVDEAEAFPAEISAEEAACRTDFRALPTFTMDGATAKDFDDALSIERIPGGWRLGVHIADVSHYVTEGSALDLEAYERATSIYPVDRVVPMLPERLSNDLCSLRPRVDRLVMSCIMDIDGEGRVHHYSVHEGIIRSAHRLIYEDVQAVIEGRAEPALARQLGDIRVQLDDLYALRRVLTEMRMRRGALDLDLPETEVVFEGDEARLEGSPEEGAQIKHAVTASEKLRMERRPIGLVRRPRLESHRVVEEAMLIANEVVATHLFNLHIPSVYRVHEPPDPYKLRQTMPILAHLGVRFPGKKDVVTPEAIQAALDAASKLETGTIARRLILRSMMRARYADENLGHYGLGSTCYTHFTSPIRRYPDLIVHRLLRETMSAGAPTEGEYAPPGENESGRARRSDSRAGRSQKQGTTTSTKSPRQEFRHHAENHDAVSGTLSISDEIVPRAKHQHQAPPESPTQNSEVKTQNSQSALPRDRFRYYRNTLAATTAHCSDRERRAEDIENDATKLKALEFMSDKLGEEYDGMIVGVTSFGFFVELEELPVEGLVHVRQLKGDFYEFDEERIMLVGRSRGESYKLGDKVAVMVETVDTSNLQLDFQLVAKITGADSVESRADAHRRRKEAERRHEERRPRHGGFQARGKRRGRK